MASFGEILTELRKDRKMTQHELAAVLYVSDGTIPNYEKGTHYPDAAKIISLARYFHVTIDYLMGESRYNLPSEVWAKSFVDEVTVGQLVKEMEGLPVKQKRIIAEITAEFNFNAAVRGYSEANQK